MTIFGKESEKRERMVEELLEKGPLEDKDKDLKEAMREVQRENFVPWGKKKWSYNPSSALRIPGENATISAPEIYAVAYRNLDLEEGDNFLEIGTGSGYGAALAKEIVGEKGEVTSIEIDEETYEFAKDNLEGYDVDVIPKNGREGYEEKAPYDEISITGAVSEIPDPLREQLKEEGKLVAPVKRTFGQKLVLYEKEGKEMKRKNLLSVKYVPLRQEE